MDKIDDILSQIKVADGDNSNGQPENCLRCDGFFWLAVEAPVGDRKFGKMEPCECQAVLWGTNSREGLLNYAQLGPLERATFENTLPDGRGKQVDGDSFRAAFETSREFAAKPVGGLLLTGPPRVGKTHLAAAIINAQIARSEPALFIRMARLTDVTRPIYGEPDERSTLFTMASEAPLLVLDDLGSNLGPEWAATQVDRLLTQRTEKQLPTVVTSQLNTTSMGRRIGALLGDPSAFQTACINIGAPHYSALVGMPTVMLKRMTFKNFNPAGKVKLTEGQRSTVKRAFNFARQFAADPQGWLYLYGNPGAGKTHLATAIVDAGLRNNRRVIYRRVSDMLDELRQFSDARNRSFNERATLDDFKRVELLVLEDFGLQVVTEWADEKLFQIIAHRYDHRLPTVITSLGAFSKYAKEFGLRNISDMLKDEKSFYRDALLSRIGDQEFVQHCEMLSPDLRTVGEMGPSD